MASESDLAIARYDALTADEIISRLAGLSQVDLAKVDCYERRHENRTTVLDRVSSLRGDEPWPGYDELNVAEIRAALAEADDDRLRGGAHVRARAQGPHQRARRRRARAQRRLSHVSGPRCVIAGRSGYGHHPMSQIQEHAADDDLPLRNYDRQSGNAIAAKLRAFSQRELRAIGAYEAEHERRGAVLARVAELSMDEPWPGYDEQDGDEIIAALTNANATRAIVYEREHKARAAIIAAASRALAV